MAHLKHKYLSGLLYKCTNVDLCFDCHSQVWKAVAIAMLMNTIYQHFSQLAL